MSQIVRLRRPPVAKAPVVRLRRPVEPVANEQDDASRFSSPMQVFVSETERKTELERSVFTASAEQQAYFDWIGSGTGSAILEAVAGAGKSTTLIEGLPLMDGYVFLGAYNKAAADELYTKAKAKRYTRQGLNISTMHSHCFRNWTRQHDDVQIDEKKVHLILQGLTTDPAQGSARQWGFRQCDYFIKRMVSLGKQQLAGVYFPINDFQGWYNIMEYYGTDDDLPEGFDTGFVIELVQDVFRRSAALCNRVVDFDDMIFAPLFHNIKFLRKDWFLMDECQDANLARIEAAIRSLNTRGRFVGVGDRHQAIYGFTGADSRSMDILAERFRCTQLSLSVSYRCPIKVVEYVRQWVSHIKPHPDAAEGNVRDAWTVCPACQGKGTVPAGEAATGQENEQRMICTECAGKGRPWFLIDEPGADDAVLCRTNAPLIQTAYAMIREGKACMVEGRDIGRGLIKLAQRWKVKTIEALERRLEMWLAKERQLAQSLDKPERADRAEDQIATLRLIFGRCRERGRLDVRDVVEEVDSLFRDDVKGVTTLSSIHKAKGREWPRVYWLQIADKGHAKKDWERQQEVNLKYVAGTRAKAELILVPESAIGEARK